MQSLVCGAAGGTELTMKVQFHSSCDGKIGAPPRRICFLQPSVERRKHARGNGRAQELSGRCVDPVSVHATRAGSLVCHAYGQPGAYDNNPYHPASQQSQFAGSNMMGRQNSSALATVDNGNSALKTKDQPKTVQVRFWLKFHVDYGQSIRLIGGHDQAGGWNLAKAPYLQWSEGDLWNVTLELAAGGVYEYKYVVVEGDGTTAASWQRGANNVLALQLTDEEVEVYDNWKNAPGALVLVDGQEITRERKLLAWANDMTVQRSELRRTRMELAQAREEIRVLRAELSVLRMEVSEANIARAAAETRQADLERQNSSLRLEIAAGQASARSTMEEAVRLLTNMSDDDTGYDPSSSGGNSTASYAAANTGPSTASSSSNGAGGGGGGGVFGSLFGFQMPGGNGRTTSRVDGDQTHQSSGPNNAASAVVAAAAAMAAAADPRRLGGAAAAAGPSGNYSPQTPAGPGAYKGPQRGGGGSSSGSSGADGSSEAVSANAKS